MSTLFIAPHSDDESLFGSYIIQRTDADVLIVTDGSQHHRKFGVLTGTRREESKSACKILKAPVSFLGFSDEYGHLTLTRLVQALSDYRDQYGLVFAPVTIKGAHETHNLVSEAVEQVWGHNAMYYGIYEQGGLKPLKGEMTLVGTDAEKQIKQDAMNCYRSQIKLNEPFFIANKDADEYLSFKRTNA